MENVEIISISMVEATSDKKGEGTQRIELTPCDLQLLLLGTIQKGLVFLKPRQSNQKNLVQHLKSSLSRALEFFFPLTGRLSTTEHDDNTISFFIDCNNAGAQFVHAVADGVTVADILQPIYVPPIVKSFFPLNGVKNHEAAVSEVPLLGVQVTELVDGLFVGLTMNHSVADGTSFWHFVNSWSEISRGCDNISNTPVLHRSNSILSGINHPFPISSINFSSKKKISDGFISAPFKERFFHFSRPKVAQLKAKANSEAGTHNISSLQSLLAHFWRSEIRCREQYNFIPNQETNLNFAVGIRSRLQPPLAEEYFGNAFIGGAVTLKAKELLEQGLGYVALQINKSIVEHTSEDKLRSVLDSCFQNFRPITESDITTNALLLSSSQRFNIYGNDFGWGRPVAVRSGMWNCNGRILVHPGVEEDGSMDIEACLSPEILQAMENDLEFMDAVSI